MDLSFSDSDKAFREEVQVFLDSSLDDDLRYSARLATSVFQDFETSMRWHRILSKKGWIAPSWPVEYGGTGWSEVQKYIWAIECGNAGAPSLAPMGLAMCGPMLMGYGTQEQKDFYLPRMLSGEDFWCQGYSEPGSGSDLASLKLRADRDGSDYILNGTKIWTSMAHHANRMFCLVRTDFESKPQAGISFLLLEMDSPGIDVEPIISISSDHELNQVFFSDVRVPIKQLVGKENEGWTVAKYLLAFERGGTYSPRLRKTLEGVRALISEQDLEGEGLTQRIENLEIQISAMEFTEHRVMASLSQGGAPGPEASMLKTRGTELQQEVTELGVEALGVYGMAEQKAARTVGSNIEAIGPASGIATMPLYLNTRAASIYGGSNQVQRNIMAKMVLGL